MAAITFKAKINNLFQRDSAMSPCHVGNLCFEAA